jgi:hypothetical protein
MSNVPSAVAKAEQLADRLHQELIASQQQANTGDGQTPPTPPSNEQPTQQSQPQETPAPDDGSQQSQQTPPATDDWEHRFKVLQGKYNSEVPRFANENKELKRQLDELVAQVAELKKKPAEPLVRPEEIEEYGDGLVDLIRRAAREEVAAKDAEIEQLKSQLKQVSEVTTNTVTKDFWKSLTEMVPDWEALNSDAGFLRWLDEVDDLTGETRISLLGKAEASRDAVRAAQFFKRYKQTSSSWAANSNQSLANQVVPATNKAPDTPPSKKVWTRAEIGEFYSRVRRGEVSDQDAIAIEADITAASIEGRIR